MCGEPATTRDHVPPRGIFSKPYPKNLLTVPACQRCNEGSKLDDEYFRTMVAAASRDSAQSKLLLAQKIIPGVREKPALAIQILKASVWKHVTTKDGKTERIPELTIEVSRIQRVIEKIIKGLYWKHIGEKFPSDCSIDSYTFLYLPDLPEPIGENLLSLPINNIGDGSYFSYRYHVDQTTSEGVWLLLFFGRCLFVVQTFKGDVDLKGSKKRPT